MASEMNEHIKGSPSRPLEVRSADRHYRRS
jgi:hypothetical protein